MVRPVTCVLLVVAYLGPTVLTEERIDSEVNWKIRREATTNSHVLTILHQLTDVYGPRLTGSPNLEKAGRWSLQGNSSLVVQCRFNRNVLLGGLQCLVRRSRVSQRIGQIAQRGGQIAKLHDTSVSQLRVGKDA